MCTRCRCTHTLYINVLNVLRTFIQSMSASAPCTHKRFFSGVLCLDVYVKFVSASAPCTHAVFNNVQCFLQQRIVKSDFCRTTGLSDQRIVGLLDKWTLGRRIYRDVGL
jgi:hypothetical protein